MAIQQHNKNRPQPDDGPTRDLNNMHQRPAGVGTRGSCVGLCGQWDAYWNATVSAYDSDGNYYDSAYVKGTIGTPGQYNYSCDKFCSHVNAQDCGYDFCEVCGGCEWTCNEPWPEFSSEPNYEGWIVGKYGEGCGDHVSHTEDWCSCGNPGGELYHPSCSAGQSPPNCDEQSYWADPIPHDQCQNILLEYCQDWNKPFVCNQFSQEVICNAWSNQGCVWDTNVGCTCSGDCTEPRFWGTDNYFYENYCCADTECMAWNPTTPGGSLSCGIFNPNNGYMPAWGCGENPSTIPGATGNDCCEYWGAWEIQTSDGYSGSALDMCCFCGGGEPYVPNDNSELGTYVPGTCEEMGKVCCKTRTVQADGTGAAYVYGCKTSFNCTNHPHPNHQGEIRDESYCTEVGTLPTCNCGGAAQGCQSGFVCDRGGGTYPGCDSDYFEAYGQGNGECYCPGVSPQCEVFGSGYNALTGICVPAGSHYGNGLCADTQTGDELIMGCTDPVADNYNPDATSEDGSCTYSGCTDPDAENYNPDATSDDGSCIYLDGGECSLVNACNYNGIPPGPDNQDACMSTECGCILPEMCCGGSTPPTCEYGKSEYAFDSYNVFHCDELLCGGCSMESQGSHETALKYCNYDENCEDYITDAYGNTTGYTRCQWSNPGANCEACPELDGCWMQAGACNFKQDCDGNEYDSCPDDKTCVESCCVTAEICTNGQQTCDGYCSCLPAAGDATCPNLMDMSGGCTQSMCNNDTCPWPCDVACENPPLEQYADYYPNNMDDYCNEYHSTNAPYVCVTSSYANNFDQAEMEDMYGAPVGSHLAKSNMIWDWNSCQCVAGGGYQGYLSSLNSEDSCKFTDSQGMPTGGSSSDASANIAFAICVEDGTGPNNGARCRNDHMNCSIELPGNWPYGQVCGDASMTRRYSEPWTNSWNKQCHCDPCKDGGAYDEPHVYHSGSWNIRENGYCDGWRKPSNGSGFQHMDEASSSCSGGAGECGNDSLSSCYYCDTNDFECNTGNWFCGHYLYGTMTTNLTDCDSMNGASDCSYDHEFYLSSCSEGCDNNWDTCDVTTDWGASMGTIENPTGGDCNFSSNTGVLSLHNNSHDYCEWIDDECVPYNLTGWGSGSACSANRDRMCLYIEDHWNACFTLNGGQYDGTVNYTIDPDSTPRLTLSGWSGVQNCNSCNECNELLASGGTGNIKNVKGKLGGTTSHVVLTIDPITGQLIHKNKNDISSQDRKKIRFQTAQNNELGISTEKHKRKKDSNRMHKNRIKNKRNKKRPKRRNLSRGGRKVIRKSNRR